MSAIGQKQTFANAQAPWNRLLGAGSTIIGSPRFDEPIGYAQGHSSACQAKQLIRRDGVQIQDDELPGQSQKGNEDYNLGLDDALLSSDYVLERVVELERDQQRHDLAKDGLKYTMIQGVKGAEQQTGDDCKTEPEEGDDDD